MEVLVKFNIVRFFFAIFLWLIFNVSSANEWRTTQIGNESKKTTVSEIAVDGNNIAHIAWTLLEHSKGNSTVYYANSKDNWMPVVITKTASFAAPSIFIDKKNAVYIAWTDRRNGPNGDGSGWDIYYASSVDEWVSYLVTAGPTFAIYNPSIAVDAVGDVYITYGRFTNPRTPYRKQLFFTRKSSGWLEKKISVTGSPWLDMDIDNNGVVHVVFSNAVDRSANGLPKYHTWYANSANDWVATQVDTATDNPVHSRMEPSIDVDANNVAHIVWADSRNQPLFGSPEYHGNLAKRIEIYYANTDNLGTNVEIALPVDLNKQATKTSPSVFVQNNQVHATWIQKTEDKRVDTNVVWSQSNLFYGNSSDWDSAINISNISYIPLPVDEHGFSLPSYAPFSSPNSLFVDKNGAAHITWKVQNRVNDTYKLYYATNAMLETSAKIKLIPKVIHLKHKNKRIIARIRLTEQNDLHNIDKDSLKLSIPSCLACKTIESVRGISLRKQYFAFYSQQELIDVIKVMGSNIPTKLEVKITGKLNDGTVFTGSTYLRIMGQKYL